MSGFRTVAVAVLIAAGLLAPMGAASAQRATIQDSGSADVWDASRNPETGEWGATEAGSVANVDVKRTTVSYTRTGIRVIAEYAELKKSGPVNPELDSWMKLSDGGGVLLRTWAQDDWDGASISFFTDKTAKPGGGIHVARCPGAKTTFNYRADTVASTIPLSCLPGDSTWVKFHGNALAASEDQDQYGSPTHIWSDNVTDASFDEDVPNRNCYWKCTGWTKVRIN
jgi:hypothetical protein